MISIAKRVLLGLFGAGVALGCGDGDSSNLRHTSQALCTGACTDGPARSLFPFAGTGIAGVGSSTSSLSAAQFSSPGGVFYTVPAIGIVPANTLIIADTGNNRIRTATASSVMDIAGGAGQNLLTNPGCDGPLVTGGVSGWDGPPPPGPSVPFQCYSTTSPLSPPLSSSFHPDSFDGNLYFAGSGSSTFLQQDVPVAAYAQQIDAGSQAFILNAYGITPGSGWIEISSLDTNKTTLGVVIRANSIDRFWTRLNRRLVAQIGTRFVRIKLHANAGPIAFDGLSLVAEGASPFNKPQGLATKGTSTVLIADTYNDRVQALLFSGAGFSTTLSPAGLEAPTAVAVDPNNGTIYIADFNHHRIARWSGIATDTPTTFAGIGGGGWSGDGGLATAAALRFPSGVAVDSVSNVYIADRSNAVIRKVGTDGKIQTIAGVAGVLANDGDGGAATTAHFIRPWAVSVGSDGALYVDDVGAHNIRKIKAGVITTVAGNGSQGSSGDNGSALLAQFDEPSAFSLDAVTGNLYVADTGNHRIRIATCGDQNACTGVESYSSTSGLCAAGVALNPNDSNSCTTDTCDPLLGAVHTNVSPGTSCADTNLCNGAETCNGSGACLAGTPIPIDDGNVCTSDSCNPSTGVASHTIMPGAQCSAAMCVAGVQTFPGQCTVTGTCAPGATLSCGKYVCGQFSCLGSCTADSQCVASAYCDTQTGSATLNNCLSEVGPSQACLRDRQCTAGACVDGGCCDATVSADPLAAAAISSVGPTDFVSQVSSLYTGSSATQSAQAGAVDPNHVAVVVGHVLNEAGTAGLPCIKVSVLGAPNLGSVRTRADGAYTIAVNGGAPVTLRFELSTYLSVDRQVDTKWHAYSTAQDVRLLGVGSASVQTGTTGTAILSGLAETDAQGTRTARLLVPPGTTATVEGETSPRPSFVSDIQIKEMTNLSKTGRDGMVASLPTTSAFTYAVSLSLRGAENKAISLSNAVPFYVDNFLGMPNGESVPVGYYDTHLGQWVASTNGRVITIVGKDLTTGEAQLDLDATPGAESTTSADMVALGITSAERVELAVRYPTFPTSLWRFTTTHFSAWDANWGWGPPPGAGPPSGPPPHGPTCGCCGSGGGKVGSIIDCEKQGLREKVQLAGTPYELFYSSRNQVGGIPPLQIPIAGTTLPPGVSGIQLEVYIAGKKFTQSWAPPFTLPLSYDFFWDGRDAAGRRLYGAQPVLTRTGYTYPGSYQRTPQFAALGNGIVISASRARFDATLWTEWSGFVDQWDAQHSGLGGWDMSVHHGYDPESRTLHLGTGETQVAPSTALNPMRTLAKGDQTQATFGLVNGFGGTSADGIAVDSDGTIYFNDSRNNRISKLVPGGSQVVYSGLAFSQGLAIGPDHKLYATGNSQVVRIDPASGVGEVIAGKLPVPQAHTDGPALQVDLANPIGIAVAPDGTVYVAAGGPSSTPCIRRIRNGQMSTLVSQGNARAFTAVVISKAGDVYFSMVKDNDSGVYRVDPTGSITRIAGGGTSYGDGGPATLANLIDPEGLAFGPDGLLYIVDSGAPPGIPNSPGHHTIRRIDALGNILTVVGTGFAGDGKDGLAANATALNTPGGIAFDSSGLLYVTDDKNQKIRATTVGLSTSGGYIPSADGSELFFFDANSRHLKTVDAHTGIPKYFFRYDAGGFLTGIANRDLNDPTRLETQIIRDGLEVPTSIKSPFGQTTTLSVVNGQLVSVTDPENGVHQFSYASGGLIQTLSEPSFPAGTSYGFTFTNGQLSQDTDPLQHSQNLTVSALPNVSSGQRITHTDQLGRPTVYDTQVPDPATMLSVITTPDALQSARSIRTDGFAAYLAPNNNLYSARQTNPDGSTAFWQIANDGVSGVRSPFVSSRIEFMGSLTDPTKVTSFTRAPALNDPNDLSSVTSYSETDTVNTHSSTLFYNAAPTSRTFTSTSRAGRTSTRTLDAFGRTIATQLGNLTPITYAYDDSTTSGTGTQQVSQVEQNDTVVDRKTTYTYFPSGSGKATGYLKQVSHIQPGAFGQTTTYTRDAFGRVLTATTGSDVPTLAWTDGRGNLTTVTPTAGFVHAQGYDLLNQIKTYTPPLVTPTTTPVASTFTYTDDRQRSTLVTPDGITASWTYDPTSGKLAKVTPDTASPSVAATYGYFTAADLTNHVPGAAPGQLSQINGPYGVNLAFQYLGALPTKVTWAGSVVGSVAWTYDNDFARISETVSGSAGSAATAFGYDFDKFITCASSGTCNPPDANALAVVHDPSAGLLSLISMGRVQEKYSYTNFGELAQKLATSTTPASTLAEFDFDQDRAGDNGTWAAANRRDALGRISRKIETVIGVPTSTYDFTYSAEGRLTDVRLNGSTSEHYDYDANGNRIAGTTPIMAVTSAQTQYDHQDRLLKYGIFTYTYTNNGELKTKTDTSTTPNQVTTYAYDTLGNLRSVTPTTGPAISYIVDGMNRRVAKKSGTTIVKQWLYHDGLKPVAELDGAGTLLSTFVYASNQHVPDYMIRGGKTYRVITDQVGSARLVVNVADTTDIPFKASYTAFGEATLSGIADFLPFGFAGGMYDIDTKLVRFGLRDYDPTVGRWVSKDPILFDGGQADLYVYVGNDPVNRLDPFGRKPTGCDAAVTLGTGLFCFYECKPIIPNFLNLACSLICGLGGLAIDDGLCHPPKPKPPTPPGPSACGIGPTPLEPGEAPPSAPGSPP